MYITRLVLDNIRTFSSSEIAFVHPDLRFRSAKDAGTGQDRLLPRPRLPNVNLLLGENASGKTTILQAIALAALGPAARDSKLPIRKLVRLPRQDEVRDRNGGHESGDILANFAMHDQDRVGSQELEVMQRLERLGELETIDYSSVPFEDWEPIYESKNDSFFCVAYGAFRRVESADNLEIGARAEVEFPRSQRVRSVFQDDYPLNRLGNWLPKLKGNHQARYAEVIQLLHKSLGPGHIRFSEKVKDREYLFERGGTLVPFPALSDGYRGFIGWVGDLLYHMCVACPPGKMLVDLAGIVMVDEVDLLLHPRWQMKVIGTVAKALPRIQFIFTSHSPLLAGSLEWMNIITLAVGTKTNRTMAKRLRQSIHGLDADQILLSDFFGLKTTIAPAKRQQLDEITARVRSGDRDAPLQLIRELSSGTEVEE
jgi:hypothetical protein